MVSVLRDERDRQIGHSGPHIEVHPEGGLRTCVVSPVAGADWLGPAAHPLSIRSRLNTEPSQVHRIVCGPTRTHPDAWRSCFETWPTLSGVGIGQIDLRAVKTA